MSESPLLEVKNLTTSFETENGTFPAVDRLSFKINPREVFGVVGESGSGKTMTAFSILQLVDQPGKVDADSILFKGKDLTEMSEQEMRQIRGGEISMIFQDPLNSLNPVMTVGEQIAEVHRHHTQSGESTGFWSEMKRKYVTGTSPDSPSWKRAVELIEKVGIPDPEKRANEYPHQLSGGMKQRIMIAQAIAAGASLIIADEPTTSLDVTIQRQILSELVGLRDEFGVSIMLITHDLGVVREVCDRVMVMYAGELMESAPTDNLFRNPEHPYTQGLMQSIPRLEDERDWLNVIEGSVPELVNKPVGCPFRNRCELAFERCDQPLEETRVTQDHVVRCHLHSVDSGSMNQMEETATSSDVGQGYHGDS